MGLKVRNSVTDDRRKPNEFENITAAHHAVWALLLMFWRTRLPQSSGKTSGGRRLFQHDAERLSDYLTSKIKKEYP